MNRKELKKEAKKVLKKNYLKCILVAFIVGLVLNSGYSYTSNKNQEEEQNQEIIIHGEKSTTYDTMERFLKDINIDIHLKSDYEKTKGLAAPIVNKLAEGKSPVIYLLNFIDLAFFKNNIGTAMISLIVTILVILNYFFIQNLITIGDCRFFLETRRYTKTKIEKVLYPYKSKKILHLAYIVFMKELYTALWGLTIIGGIIKYYEYSMIPYILAENPSISKKDAFRLTKILTKGYKWELFKLDVSMIGWELLASITFSLSNLFFTNAYKKCILAEFYMKVRNENEKDTKDYLTDKKLAIEEMKEDIYPEPKKEKKTQTDFNRNYKPTTYILFFFTFAFVGWLYEVIIHLIKDGTFVNRGTMFGPWLPIYGFGVIFILLLLKPFRKNYLAYFLSAIVLAALLEYTTSWYLEAHLGMKWWDYSGYFLNLHGRICFEGLLVFGLGGCTITYLIAPLLDDLYSKIIPKIKIIICILLLATYGTDLVYSFHHPNTGKGITDYEKS